MKPTQPFTLLPQESREQHYHHYAALAGLIHRFPILVTLLMFPSLTTLTGFFLLLLS